MPRAPEIEPGPRPKTPDPRGRFRVKFPAGPPGSIDFEVLALPAERPGFCSSSRYTFTWKIPVPAAGAAGATARIAALTRLLGPFLSALDERLAPDSPGRMAELAALNLPRYSPFATAGYTVESPSPTGAGAPAEASSVSAAHRRQIVAGISPVTGLVRTGFLCNQDCVMCWQDRGWGADGRVDVRPWIDELRAEGATALIVSGGEPTLDPDLLAVLRHAAAAGFRSISVETNAVLLARPGAAARLREAGATEALVSLHSSDPGVSDAITRAPGTHARTVAGIGALLDAGVAVFLNAVLTRHALPSLPSLPGFIVQEFGTRPRLTLSYPVHPFRHDDLPRVLPALAELRAVVPAALRRAAALGLELGGVDGPCGLPLCALETGAHAAPRPPVPSSVPDRTHLPPCDACEARLSCFGVTRTTAELFGETAVLPFLPEGTGR